MLKSDLPLGLRNNNPGNLRPSDRFKWVGEVGENDGFIVFDTPENGLRAMARNLRTYRDKHNRYTVRDIIERWAPSSENNTEAYIAHVANQLAVPDNQALQLDQYVPLMAAIIRHENGQQPYTAAQLKEGFARGFEIA